MSKTVDIESNITGTVWKIEVEVGARVSEGDPVITVESMKMEIPIVAPEDGEIVEILVGEEDHVDDGMVVARIRY